jgi:hypothetical protein
VLSIDADERVTAQLAVAIETSIAAIGRDGWEIRRLARFLGQCLCRSYPLGCPPGSSLRLRSGFGHHRLPMALPASVNGLEMVAPTALKTKAPALPMPSASAAASRGYRAARLA